MSERPYFKMYASDFIAGVSGMTAEQIGVYSVLLNMMYARRKKLECRSSKDVQGLARTCGCTTRTFNRILDELVAMPNKITRDDQGRLSNPKFERLMRADSPTSIPPVDKEQALFPPLNPSFFGRKIQDNLEIKSSKNETTSNNSKGLTHTKPLPTRARARPIVQKEEESSVMPGPPGTHMTLGNFNLWAAAVKATIPKGWSRPQALRQWQSLPSIELDVMVQAWRDYLAHASEQSKTAKFPQRIQYPENWFRNRVYESFAETALEKLQHQRDIILARDKTIASWNGKAASVIAAIGQHKFDAWLVGSSIVAISEHEYVISVPRQFAAKHISEDSGLLRLISKALNASVTVAMDRKTA